MSAKTNRPNEAAKKETAGSHQPGQSAFAAILPEEVDWKPFPAFPPSARLAIVVGRPQGLDPGETRLLFFRFGYGKAANDKKLPDPVGSGVFVLH